MAIFLIRFRLRIHHDGIHSQSLILLAITPSVLDQQLETEVSGGYQALYFFSRLEKPSGWEQNLEAICELKARAVSQSIELLEVGLARLKNQNLEDTHYDLTMSRHHTMAQLYAYLGELQKAIEHFQAAQRIAATHGLRDLQLQFLEMLGITEMRRVKLRIV